MIECLLFLKFSWKVFLYSYPSALSNFLYLLKTNIHQLIMFIGVLIKVVSGILLFFYLINTLKYFNIKNHNATMCDLMLQETEFI